MNIAAAAQDGGGDDEGRRALLRWLAQILLNAAGGEADLRSAPEPRGDEDSAHLLEALSELPLEYRKVIFLVFNEGLTPRQAGEKLGGRSEDALRMMLRRAESKLGDILERKFGKDPE